MSTPIDHSALTENAKASLAEDSMRFVHRRTWAFRMGVVGLTGMTFSCFAVLQILINRKVEGMWDAIALIVIPILWLLVTLIPGIVWATNARAVDIARLASAVRGDGVGQISSEEG